MQLIAHAVGSTYVTQSSIVGAELLGKFIDGK